jgi:hypothetical protein
VRFPRIGVVAVIATAVACTSADKRDTNDTAAASRAESSRDTTWSIRPDRAGPVRVGMTAADARRVLGLPGDSTNNDGCSYLEGVAGTALHANVMLTSDTVVRFDVLDSAIATAEGARVGDTEDQIRKLYAGRVTVQPHKYVPNGHYLVVTAPGDTADRIVFETDGKVVTKYRAGRTPEVELVEGCG